MKTNIKIFIIFIFILSSACSSYHPLKSRIVTRNGIKMLYGETSRQQLFYDFPDWQEEYNLYEVNRAQADSLKNLRSSEFSIDIYFGTWCGDSKREVPYFYKILDETNVVPENKVNLFAVDRQKKMDDGSAEKNMIERVATFIFKKNYREVGRIVEYPQKSLESDIIKILRSN